MAASTALPEFRVAAAVSGKQVDNAFLAGRRAVLVVHGIRGTDVPKEVAKAVRSRWPRHEDLALVSIVDLRAMAGLWRKVAEAQVKQTYDRMAARAREAGLVPEEQVLICPDWDGTVSAALGIPEPDKAPTALVADAEGRVLARATGTPAAIAASVLEALG